MISKERSCRAAAISATSGAILPASFRTGTTTDMPGSGPRPLLSTMAQLLERRPTGRNRAAVVAPSRKDAPGGGLDPPERRPRIGPQIGRGKDQAPRREPAPHHERADNADQHAANDVARMMG